MAGLDGGRAGRLESAGMDERATEGTDEGFMREALAEARRGEGGTRPNPPVGAVLVREGRIVARGHHRRAGGPHAEVDCLARAPAGAARGGTLYVTLEPCSTSGRTGPCTEAIRAAGVARVVAAATDRNPRHAGRGFAALRAAGVEVAEGVCREEAERMLAPFFRHVETGLPWVTLKMAQSLDGGIADHAGVSKWITGPEARAEVAALRRRADCVLVGSGTVLADDPSLLRKGGEGEGLPGMRCALDARGRIPPTARIFADGHADRTVVATSAACPAERRAAWRAAGAAVWELPTAFPRGAQGEAPALDLRALLRRMGEEGFLHVLCEGGAGLASALVNEGLADAIELFVAPIVLGRGSLRTFGAYPFDLPTAPRYRVAETARCGADLRIRLERDA